MFQTCIPQNHMCSMFGLYKLQSSSMLIYITFCRSWRWGSWPSLHSM